MNETRRYKKNCEKIKMEEKRSGALITKHPVPVKQKQDTGAESKKWKVGTDAEITDFPAIQFNS